MLQPSRSVGIRPSVASVNNNSLYNQSADDEEQNPLSPSNASSIVSPVGATSSLSIAASRFRASVGDGGVVIHSNPVSPVSPIALPAYRAALTPRPHFTLFGWQRRFVNGKTYAPPVDDRQQNGRQQGSSDLSWPLRLRYAGILLHPTLPLKRNHFYSLLFFLLSLLIPYAGLYPMISFLSCYAPAAVTPFLVCFSILVPLIWFGFYVGGLGPFHCDTRDIDPVDERRIADEEEKTGITSHTKLLRRTLFTTSPHRFFPARFPMALALILLLLSLQTLLIAKLSTNLFELQCILSDTELSVNQAPSFGSSFALTANTAATGADIPWNNGSQPYIDAASTKQYMRFYDGFIETRLVRGLNVTDVQSEDGGGGVTTFPSFSLPSLPPSRMLLLAPIFSSFLDPFNLHLVPVWAVGSFAWSSNTLETYRAKQAVVDAWSQSFRFGRTLTPLDQDYLPTQILIETFLAEMQTISPDLAGYRMKQMNGAPFLLWSDPSVIENQVHMDLLRNLVISGGIFLLFWLPFTVWHLRWYSDMIRQEQDWQALVDKRGASQRKLVSGKSKVESEVAEEPDEAKSLSVDPSSALSASAVSVPKQVIFHTEGRTASSSSLFAPTAPSNVQSNVSRTPSLTTQSSFASAVSGIGGPSRPGTASTTTSAAGGWTKNLLATFGKQKSVNSVLPDPAASTTPHFPTTRGVPQPAEIELGQVGSGNSNGGSNSSREESMVIRPAPDSSRSTSGSADGSSAPSTGRRGSGSTKTGTTALAPLSTPTAAAAAAAVVAANTISPLGGSQPRRLAPLPIASATTTVPVSSGPGSTRSKRPSQVVSPPLAPAASVDLQQQSAVSSSKGWEHGAEFNSDEDSEDMIAAAASSAVGKVVRQEGLTRRSPRTEKLTSNEEYSKSQFPHQPFRGPLSPPVRAPPNLSTTSAKGSSSSAIASNSSFELQQMRTAPSHTAARGPSSSGSTSHGSRPAPTVDNSEEEDVEEIDL